MSVILFVIGILLTGVGIILVGFAIPINESAIGQTLIIAGAVAIVGGPVLVGLGAAVSQLAHIAAGLRAKPASRTGRVAAAVQRAEEIFPDPLGVEARSPDARVGQTRSPDLRLPDPSMAEPFAVGAADASHVAVAHQTAAASATSLDRLRATMARPAAPVPAASTGDVENVPLSPNGNQHPTAPALEPSIEAASRTPEPAARPASGDGGASKEPRLDFLFRSRPTRPPATESFDSMWPKRNPRGPADAAKVERAERAEKVEKAEKLEEAGSIGAITMEPPAPVEERRAALVMEDRRAAPRVSALQPDEARPMVAILKSGVVDGMAYTLYADGSIEAQLPQGTVRFGSIAELRAHIENNS